MGKQRMIFLDDGGVLNDNERRAAEWRRLIGEYLAPRLGGAPEAWGEANRVVFDRQWRRFEAWQRTAAVNDLAQHFFDAPGEQERWLGEMCDEVGIRRPAPEECVALAVETQEYVIPRVRAAYPDAVDAVRALHHSGARLSTASGGSSRELHHYLTGMGVRGFFGERLYGPDLVRRAKPSPDYYRRIFEMEGIEPQEALVVDDSPQALDGAAVAGARTVLVARDGRDHGRRHTTVPDLRGLVEALEQGFGGRARA